MTHTLISNISADHVGQTITVKGRIQTIRSSGKVAFIELRDGSGYMQCVAEPNAEKQSLTLDVPFSTKVGDCYLLTPTDNPPQEGKKTIQRDHVDCIVKHRSEEKYLFLKRKINGRLDFVGGGLDGLSPIDAGFKEITEETGYTDIELLYQIPEKTKGNFYHARKDLNVIGYDYPVVYRLRSDAQQSIEQHESDAHEMIWLTEEEVIQQGINFTKVIWSLYKHYDTLYTTKGLAITPKYSDFGVIEKSIGMGNQGELEQFGDVSVREHFGANRGAFFSVKVCKEKEQEFIAYLQKKFLASEEKRYADSMNTTNIVVFEDAVLTIKTQEDLDAFVAYGLKLGIPKEQLDIKLPQPQKTFETLSTLGIESSLSLTGTVSKHPKKDEYELQVSDFFVYQDAKDYPLGTKADHGPEFLFDQRHLYLRSKTQRAIQRVRDTIIHATYDRMRDHDFTKIDSPIFTPNACEGTTELYAVKHVNDEIVYLSQSGQLYLEAAIASVGKCYDFGPVFRAEHCKTRRHMNEFWMMDAEIPFAQQEENMQAQEQLIFFILQEVLKKNRADLVACGANIDALEKISFPFRRITHAERCVELAEMGFEVPADGDIGSDLEMQYCQRQDQPVFVTNFPVEQKAFYFKEDPNLPGTVLGADLLAPGDCGEIIGGGTRLDDHDLLLEAMKKHKLPIEEFQRYLDLRKYGSVPHAGFGYGLERLVRWLCSVHHIRETIPFPRYNNRLRP